MTHSEDSSTSDGEENLCTLESTGLFRPEQIQALQGHWIETIDQFLSTTATVDGCEGMVRLLDVSECAFNDIRAHLSQLVPSVSRDEIGTPQPGGALGVILTDEQKRQGGCSKEGSDL